MTGQKHNCVIAVVARERGTGQKPWKWDRGGQSWVAAPGDGRTPLSSVPPCRPYGAWGFRLGLACHKHGAPTELLGGAEPEFEPRKKGEVGASG